MVLYLSVLVSFSTFTLVLAMLYPSSFLVVVPFHFVLFLLVLFTSLLIEDLFPLDLHDYFTPYVNERNCV